MAEDRRHYESISKVPMGASSSVSSSNRLLGFLRISLRILCISRGCTSSRLLGVDGCLKVFDERVSTIMLEDRQVGQEHKRLWRLRSGR